MLPIGARWLACALLLASVTGQAAMPAVSAGGGHNVALRADGSVRTWGSDSAGQLGLGRTTKSASPAVVNGISGVKTLAAGGTFTIALKDDGTVWGWGDNLGSYLGDGTTYSHSTPIRVPGLEDVVAISASSQYSLAVRGDGSVWIWGNATIGVLGSNEFPSRPTRLIGLDGVVAVSAGDFHALALKGDGTVWAWGENRGAELGDGTTQPRSIAVRVSGLTGVVAIAAGSHTSVALTADGRVWTWPQDVALVPIEVPGLGGVVALSQSSQVTYALKGDGTVWAWARYGSIGDGTAIPRPDPVQVPGLADVVSIAAGTRHSIAVKGDGTAWSWGANDEGQLGDGTLTARLAFVRVGLSGAVSASPGSRHSVALKGDGTIWAWGSNVEGQLGDGVPIDRTTPAAGITLDRVIAVSAGYSHTLALTPGGNVWAWGDNYRGTLGDGSRTPRSTPVQVLGLTGIVAISAGWSYSIAVHGDGSVWAWGSNEPFGELGDGTRIDRPIPVRVVGLDNVVGVSAGFGHAMALKSDGTVWEWGALLTDSGPDGVTVRTIPAQVPGLVDVVAVSAGGHFSLALTRDGSLWAWGLNFTGALCDGTTIDRLTPVRVAGLANVVGISASVHHTALVRRDGSVWSCGSNYYGQLGAGGFVEAGPVQAFGLTDAVAVSAGYEHTVARRSDGSVWAWGNNVGGRLGDGTYVWRNRPVVVVAEGGGGTLDGNDWFLDLDPERPGAIPAASVPTALVNAQKSGSGALDATVKYRSSEYGTRVGNYVLALVPPEFFDEVKSAPGTRGAKELRSKAGGALVLAQLTPAGWTDVRGQLIAYSQGVASAAGGGASILDRTVSYPGARFCIGYGQSADAMLSAQTLREVLVSDGSAGIVDGIPCVPSGVYVSGPPASRLGTFVSFKASVVGLSPTGTVQFRDGGDALLTPALLDASNAAVATATITTASLSSGTHGIGAAYGGDALNPASTTEIPLRHEVSSPPTGTRAELSGPASSSIGTEVAFVVIVTGNVPSGTVQLRDGASDLGAPAPLVQGVASMRISTLALGSHSIAAVYSGDGANAASTSNAIAHTVYATLTTRVSLSASPNPSAQGAAVTFTASVRGDAPTGSVTFRDGGAAMAMVALANGSASMTVSTLASGVHVITADYGGDGGNQVASSAPVFQSVQAPAPSSGPNAFAFAPALYVLPGAVVVSNAITVRGLAGAAPISVAGGTYSIGCDGTFASAAGLVVGGQTVCVRHAAAGDFGRETLTTLTIGNVSATFRSVTQPSTFSASVLQLVSHYYQSILRRPLDTSGQSFWASEAMRVVGLGANPSEAFYAMAMSFFASAEYAAFNRDSAGYVADLYATFFKRVPDSTGLAFWVGNLGAGMPREILLAEFLFSGEFAAAAQAEFGPSQSRAEVNAAMDFYRGLLGRLPDDAGFAFWVARFRAAQCQGQAAILTEVEAISSAFALSGEYLARGRTPAQYVGDLYNAFLRRGGDLAGAQFWIAQVASGAQTREQVRVQFRNSAEFQSRVAAIIAQGCL